MNKKTYSTSVGDLNFLTIGEIRRFDYISLGVENADNAIYIDITKKQAVEIFKKHKFLVNYVIHKDDNELIIN
jgi:phosphoribosylformylglycinamidine (FGAM) synthase PurS component